MNGKQRTEITLETHEKIIVRVSENHSAMRFCIYCLKNVRHLPIVRAALWLGISETAAFRLVENKQIHSTESETGALLICQNSLSKSASDSD